MKDSTYSMKTLSDVLDVLRTRGYNVNFNDEPGRSLLEKTFSDFQIDKIYRFEGVSDPDDEAILYTLSSPRSGMKGFLVNGYGIYSDETISKIIEKLKFQ